MQTQQQHKPQSANATIPHSNKSHQQHSASVRLPLKQISSTTLG
jgi:hypothetical protein